MLWVAAGVVVIAIGLLDVFLVILQYDSLGVVVTRLYRYLWLVSSALTRPLGSRHRVFVRSMVAPAMIPMTIVVWLGTIIVGFALVYEPGLTHGGFTLGRSLAPSFGLACSFSASTISSLSFSDLQPRTAGYHAVAGAETVIGLGVLTLGITYVLNVYRGLESQAELATLLHHQTEDRMTAIAVLEPLFVDGGTRDLGVVLRDAHRRLIALHEQLRRYPVLYYFQSRRPYRSIPYVFTMLGETVAALCWGLPAGHEATREPALQAFATGYTSILQDVANQFLHRSQAPDDEPAAADDFEAAWRDGDEDAGCRVGDFIRLRDAMANLAQLERRQDDVDAAYRAYRDWFPFITRIDKCVGAMSADLGVGPDQLEHHPGRATR